MVPWVSRPVPSRVAVCPQVFAHHAKLCQETGAKLAQVPTVCTGNPHPLNRLASRCLRHLGLQLRTRGHHVGQRSFHDVTSGTGGSSTSGSGSVEGTSDAADRTRACHGESGYSLADVPHVHVRPVQ
jgi:hypothetical protein